MDISGVGISTLWLCIAVDSSTVKIYNPLNGLKPLYINEMCGIYLVEEGDLDGNGTCEVGYLYVWLTSQWRGYFLFTFKDGKWKYLISPNTSTKDENGGGLFETGYLLRGSGYEIAAPSGKKGFGKDKI